eukprot:TRINITY_DN18839_c0_g1_i1.p1 TRINITY_DN18839_c0_g1~~TRINITY_DN18839_c0_g1_i1.p1  ORF type:complete len:372 (+),score=92.06 TRINITY_DN18839_c0_g1_i1:116-1231(+)
MCIRDRYQRRVRGHLGSAMDHTVLGLSPAHFKIAFFVLLQGTSSVGLIMCNRYLAMSLNLSILTLGYQNMLATGLAIGCWFMGVGPTMKPWKAEHFVRVVPLTCIFSLLLWTSFQALGKVSVATIVVFRNSSPFFTAIVEYLVRGTSVSYRTMSILITMIIGAVIYTSGDLEFEMVGYMWALANLSCTVTAGMFGKSFAMGLKEEQTGLGLSCYQNLVSLPCLALVALLTGEISEWKGISYITDLDLTAQCVFLFSCVGCVTIGIATFELQKLVPQTTVTVANVTYKMITLFVNALVFGSNVGPMGLCGLVIAQCAAVMYMYDRIQQEQPPSKDTQKEVQHSPSSGGGQNIPLMEAIQADIEAQEESTKES